VSDTLEFLKRLHELESQLAFQDELHARLNEVVARQDREIMELKIQLKTLAGRVQAFDNTLATEGEIQRDEVPPHY